MVSNREGDTALEEFLLDVTLPDDVGIDESSFGSAGTNSMTLRVAALKALQAHVNKDDTNKRNKAKILTAFFLFVGSTSKAKQFPRMRRVNEPLLVKFSCASEYAAIETLFRERHDSFILDGSRLSTAFPDYAMMFHCITFSEDYMACKLLAYPNSDAVFIPNELCFAQSLQIDLDNEAQRCANEYNRHYWLSIVSSSSEVVNGPNFVYEYFKTSAADKYELIFFKSTFVPDVVQVKAQNPDDPNDNDFTANTTAYELAKSIIRAPYDFRMLKFYRILIKTFFARKQKLNYNTVVGIWNDSKPALIPEANKVPSNLVEYTDARRDGKPILLISGSGEYEDARRTANPRSNDSNDNQGRQRRIGYQ